MSAEELKNPTIKSVNFVREENGLGRIELDPSKPIYDVNSLHPEPLAQWEVELLYVNCPDCMHDKGWHMHSDGPIKRPCNVPECKCDGKKLWSHRKDA